jgi:hypothetical protein
VGRWLSLILLLFALDVCKKVTDILEGFIVCSKHYAVGAPVSHNEEFNEIKKPP